MSFFPFGFLLKLNSVVSLAKTLIDIKPRIEDYFAQELTMRERTELRF